MDAQSTASDDCSFGSGQSELLCEEMIDLDGKKESSSLDNLQDMLANLRNEVDDLKLCIFNMRKEVKDIMIETLTATFSRQIEQLVEKKVSEKVASRVRQSIRGDQKYVNSNHLMKDEEREYLLSKWEKADTIYDPAEDEEEDFDDDEDEDDEEDTEISDESGLSGALSEPEMMRGKKFVQPNKESKISKSKADLRNANRKGSSINRSIGMQGDINNGKLNSGFKIESIKEYHFHIHEN